MIIKPNKSMVRLENILLKREEIRILGDNKNLELLVPIHPEIINDGVGITDKSLCKKALERALKPYFEDLKEHVKELARKGNPKALLTRVSYLVKEPNLVDYGNGWRITPPGWKASTEGNMLYTLVLDKAEMMPSKMSILIDSSKVAFPKQKFREYMTDHNFHSTKEQTAINGYAFTSKRITTMPQALLLRAWTVEYANMHLNQVKKLLYTE